MAKQNIYDNEVFFENFKNTREDKINFNDCIETPILFSMLPDMHNKKVLDIGCGMGQHARQYSDMGAESVLGIDISEKMLKYAKEHNSANNITYRQMAMEDIDRIGRQFDLITSSLVFDYIEDFDELMRKIYGLLKDDAELVFSMSHPMATAWDGTYDRFTRTDTGERLYANISNYCVEGRRKVKWVVDDYELYHRTFSGLINSIIKADFIIEECQESHISDEMRRQYPAAFGGTIHRPDFVFFKCRKKV
ncbi:MAG: class I SAM-dependent methyltransferase [Oscillospiraceae bacterium]|nr:class I SAM-dependent methyltransferase [Oscillospiraceae bacterium]